MVSNPSPGIQASQWNAVDLRREFSMMWAHDTSGKLIPGVIPGWGTEFAVTINSSTRVVTVGLGAAMLAAPTPGEGGWPCVNPTVWTGTLAARDATNPRIDLLIARAADVSYYAGGDNMLALETITGTPGATPVAPTVTLAHGSYLVLGQLTVPSSGNGGAITLGSATAWTTVPRVGPAGSQLRTWTVAFKQTNNISLVAGKNTGKYQTTGAWLRGIASITTAATHSGGGGIPLVTLPVNHSMPLDNISILGEFQLNGGHAGYWSGALVSWASGTAALKADAGQFVTQGPEGNFDLGAGSTLAMQFNYPLA